MTSANLLFAVTEVDPFDSCGLLCELLLFLCLILSTGLKLKLDIVSKFKCLREG
jgi:hypothetical protein